MVTKYRLFFGNSIWDNLLIGDRAWLDAYGFKEGEDFEPNSEMWLKVLEFIYNPLEKSGLHREFGLVLHFKSTIPDTLKLLEYTEDFNEAFKVFSTEKKIEIRKGLHCSFTTADLPLEGKYPSVLKRDLEAAERIGAEVIVAHPYRGNEDRLEEFTDLLTSDDVIDIMKKFPGIKLAWENMPSYPHDPSFFGSLDNMLKFRKILADKLADRNAEELIERHMFCPDTGHLLISYTGKDGAPKPISEKIIREFAPFIKVWHIHANDGVSDLHLPPYAIPNDKKEDREFIKRFTANSDYVTDFVVKTLPLYTEDVHLHMELLTMPVYESDIFRFLSAFKEKAGDFLKIYNEPAATNHKREGVK